MWALACRKRKDGDLHAAGGPSRTLPAQTMIARCAVHHPTQPRGNPKLPSLPPRAQTKHSPPRAVIRTRTRSRLHLRHLAQAHHAKNPTARWPPGPQAQSSLSRDGSNVPAAALVGEPDAAVRRRRAGAGVGAAAVGGGAAELRGAATVLVRRPRAAAGVGGALREGLLGGRAGEEGQEELCGGGGGRGQGGGGVRLRELRAQLRRRRVEGRGGRVLGRPRRRVPPRRHRRGHEHR